MSVPRGTARALRRQGYADPHIVERVARPGYVNSRHTWDDDACCTKCGFDGAEWSHWKRHTYEGAASDAHMPRCEP